MGTRRAEQLLTQIRRQSNNEAYGPNSGLSQQELLQYINDGLRDLQNTIVNEHDRAFITETFLDTVANQEFYALPDDMLDHGGIVSLEYSDSGLTPYYYKLDPLTPRERSSRVSASPSYYIRRANGILLRPIPSASVTNGLRLQYIKRLDKLNIRCGQVQSVTLGVNTITNLTLNPASFNDPTGFDEDDYLCIVDQDGNVKMRNIRFESINVGSGVVTVSASYTFQPGETIAVGDYMVIGRNTSTNQLDIDETVENYLINYAVLRAQQSDSSGDFRESAEVLAQMKQQIVDSYAQMDDDFRSVPEINQDGN